MKKNTICKLAAAVLCLTLTAGCFASCGKKEAYVPQSTVPEQHTDAPAGPVNPLTGESGIRPEAVGKRPIAIMVENSRDARPQWGLSSPDMVIEGEVEAGITRMMWLYADVQNVPKVGPTRSARHDYVELAEGLDAVYTHFGGSVYAYDALKRYGTKDIDGSKADGKYFKRDTSRKVAREHTAYTNGEWLQSAIQAKNLRTEVKADKKAPFTFAAAKRTLPDGACKRITVEFSPKFKHTFTLNETDGLYYNHMNQDEMKDANGKTMAVSNVLVLYTDIQPVAGSDKGHVDWNLKGGSGIYISNGSYQKIKWTKGTADTPSAPLKLTDESGKALELNTGKSWIGFVPSANQGKTAITAE